MTGPLFVSLDSARLAYEMLEAEWSVSYAAPGILPEPADALAALARRLGPELITVCLDFDERVMRMGFGTLDAVKMLRKAGIEVRSTPGLRTGLAIIDDSGYIFTPTALYLEAEERSDASPNAMRLAKDRLPRLLPVSRPPQRPSPSRSPKPKKSAIAYVSRQSRCPRSKWSIRTLQRSRSGSMKRLLFSSTLLVKCGSSTLISSMSSWSCLERRSNGDGSQSRRPSRSWAAARTSSGV